MRLLYVLAREHLPAGVLERVVAECTDPAGDFAYGNGWLASFAESLAERIVSSAERFLDPGDRVDDEPLR